MANQEKPLLRAEQPSKKTKETLNDDVIERILLCLPASSLLRCRLVCKTWWDIIEKPEFKKEHAELQNKKNEPMRLFVLKRGYQSKVLCKKDTDDEMPIPLWMPRGLGSDGHFGGSCNGLVCTEVKGEITVFNPVTRDVKSLPKPTNIKGYGADEYDRIGTHFIFHSATGEYKVVLFYQSSLIWPYCSVNMYTLDANGNNSWRNVYRLRRFPKDMSSFGGINVEDTIYWPYPHDDRDDVCDIISLDLSTENINIIALHTEGAKVTCLTKWYDGKLCAFSYLNGTANFWTLDYNSSEAGTMISTVRYRCQVEGNVPVSLLTPYNSIKKNIIYVIDTSNDTLICHDIQQTAASLRSAFLTALRFLGILEIVLLMLRLYFLCPCRMPIMHEFV